MLLQEDIENRPLYNYYLKLLGNIPKFLKKYLQAPSMKRLQGISYFCGMDYASKSIYDFSESITRYDHSLTTALITWKYTENKKATLAALFHDIGTPCFSHVIDYMHKDYEKQEKTEENTMSIIANDSVIMNYLKEDKIKLQDLEAKKYPIVDCDRPKLCADRFDGIILTAISWTKRLTENSIDFLTTNLTICSSHKEKELGFKTGCAGIEAKKLSDEIDEYCHSKEDNYMMNLLADIVSTAIKNDVITEKDLYTMEEDTIYIRIKNSYITELRVLINKFENIKKEEIEDILLPNVKRRTLHPLLKSGTRIED